MLSDEQITENNYKIRIGEIMKFLKKILCLTAVLSLLSGCQTTANHDNVVVIGGTYTAYEPPQSAMHNENKSTGIADDNSIAADNAPSASGFDWELRDLVLYSIDNSMYTDTTAPDGSNLRLTVPSVTYSYKDIFKFLNENAFMKKNYTLSETVRDQSSYKSFGSYGQHADASVEKMICGQKINNISKDGEVLYSDILISIGQDYNTYNQPNYFSVVLNSTSVSSEFQKMLYDLLAQQTNEKVAEYAVYGKSNSDEENPYDLYDSIPTADGRGNLIIKRNISGGGFFFEMDFQDSDEFDENRYSYYDAEYKSAYNESRITLADIFKGDFGGNDPSDDMKFFNKFMENGGRSDTGFNQAIKKNISVITTEGTNKVYRSYKFDMDLIKGCDMDEEISPDFNCNITAYFDSRSNNNSIKGNGSFIAGYTACNMCSEEEAFTELVDASREKILCLFPNMNTSSLSYENSAKKAYSLTGNYTATSSEIPVNVSVRVTLNTKYAEETDEDGNVTETDIPIYYYAEVTFSLS